jgi:ArsR family transcriptional regulator
MKKVTDPDARLFAALADPTRLAIVRQLASVGEVCACDFTGCCGVGQPTVSHHLRVLREAGMIEGERRGVWIWYRLRPAALGRLQRVIAGLAPTSDGGVPRETAGSSLPVIATRP